MKVFVFISFLIFSLAINAQNWSPILINHKMNYQHSDYNYISHTLWVDSIQVSGDDSTFFLNRIVKEVDENPYIVLRNQPQFLQKEMIKIVDSGVYTFTSPDTFYLNSLAKLNDIWVFDSMQNITATVIEVSEMDIFGITDSVKTIKLSDGQETTIRLSKNFGILEFPDLENDGVYTLVGIQGTEYGDSVPGFWEIFDFEVGNIFQYSGFSGGVGPGIYNSSTTKLTIQSKSIGGQGFEYGVKVIKAGYISTMGGTNYYTHNYTDVLTYNIGDLYYGVDKFNNELLEVDDFFCDQSWQELGFSAIKVYPDSNGIITKHYGVPIGESQGNLYISNDVGSDTLVQVIIYDCLGIPIGYSYAESLGTTMVYHGSEEEKTKRILEGYIKNGDTVGTITLDSLLLVGTDSKIKVINDILVFPNPAKDIISIKFLSDILGNSKSIDLITLTGELIRSFAIESKQTTISLEGVSKGIYIYSIKSGSIILKRGKIIKQ